MKLKKFYISLLVITVTTLSAQEKPAQWNLTNCIEYALKNNIQIQESKVSLQQNAVDTKLAKAQLFPNLTGAISQDYTNRPLLVNGGSANVYSGSYGVSSSMLLFDGGKTLKNIEQQKLNEEAGQYAVLLSEKNIQMSILQSYLQVLYASESVNINKATLDVSVYQQTRASELLKAGSISKADFAQLESQTSSDSYLYVVSQNTLSTYKLQLKQLLELSVNEDMNVAIPELNALDVLKPLQSLQSIYEKSVSVMPQLKTSKVNQKIAELETAKAKAGYLPKVSLNAGIGTSNGSGTGFSFPNQLKNGTYEGVGLSVSVPIFSNRENKSAVEKARLSQKTYQLEQQNAEKALLKEIESVFQAALSAQSQYTAALEKEKALKTSYELVEQQFQLGMKNTLQLLTEKNNLLAAQQSLLQSKYMSIMNSQLLNLYQDQPIEIK